MSRNPDFKPPKKGGDKYVAYEEKWINDRIEEDMKLICKEVLGVGRPVSIILMGSFGRGEGSVLVEKRNIVPLKDYDILLVVNKKWPASKIQNLTRKINKRLGHGDPFSRQFLYLDFVVTIFQLTTRELRHLNDVKSFEIKTGSKVLFGQDIRQEIDLSSDDLPLSSGARFLLQKVIGLVALFSPKRVTGVGNRAWGEKEKLQLFYECGKMYLDVGTALSLLAGQYKPSYLERCELLESTYEKEFPQLAKAMPYLIKTISYFTRYKLYPNKKEIDRTDPARLWFKTRDDFGLIIRYYMKQYLDVSGKDWEAFSEECYRKLKEEDLDGIISYFLKTEFHFSSKFIVKVANLLYQRLFAFRYLTELYRKTGMFPLRVLFGESPIYRVLTSALLLFFSLNKDGVIDKNRFQSFVKSFDGVYPIRLESLTDEKKWTEAMKALAEVDTINKHLIYGA